MERGSSRALTGVRNYPTRHVLSLEPHSPFTIRTRGIVRRVTKIKRTVSIKFVVSG